jgi:hypothetical protein
VTAAGRLVARLAEPAFRHREGVDTLFLLGHDRTVENLNARPGGRGDMPPGPGLGFRIDPERLQVLTRRRAVIDTLTYSIDHPSLVATSKGS